MLYHYLSYKPKQEGYDSMHDAEIRKDIRMAQAKRIRRYIGLKSPDQVRHIRIEINSS